MSKYFYKDIKIIKFCTECGIEFRPARFSWQAEVGLCYKHRGAWFKERYKKFGKEFEKKPHRKKMRYEVWKKWVIKNLERRQQQALASYHRRKHLHTGRKHRATHAKSSSSVSSAS